MNLKRMERALRVMAQAIRSEDDEDELALLLLALLLAFFEDDDAAKFHRGVMRELEDTYRTRLIEMVGKDTEDYEYLLRQELSTQETFLNGFISDMATGDVSEAKSKARIQQYATSLGKFEERIAVELLDSGAKGMWQIDESLENCVDCKELDGQVHTISWFKQNHIPKDGRTRCGANCGCAILPVS